MDNYLSNWFKKTAVYSFLICFFIVFAQVSFAASLKEAITLSASGMEVQGVRMKIIAENLANVSTTSSFSGGLPYVRKQIFFKNIYDRKLASDKVTVNKVSRDYKSQYKARYEPSHPAADSKGYVLYPNIDVSVEMADMQEAERSYEANMGALTVSKHMYLNSLDLLK